MNLTILKSKIHRATVTEADVDYEGSLTIDRNLANATDILPYEQVHVWNVTNGSRLQTYAMIAEAGSGTICSNGAAAHLIRPGDIVIIATFVAMSVVEADAHKPKIILVDEHNRIRERLLGSDPDIR